MTKKYTALAGHHSYISHGYGVCRSIHWLQYTLLEKLCDFFVLILIEVSKQISLKFFRDFV